MVDAASKPRGCAIGPPVIVASMFGNTTACVTEARRILEQAGYEVLVFHATGIGGRTMETLIESGLASGVLDITTTEWADELVGGIISRRPNALDAAANASVPGHHRSRLFGHGELRRAGNCPGKVPKPQVPSTQSTGHAHANHAAGMPGTGPDSRGKGESIHRALYRLASVARNQRPGNRWPTLPRSRRRQGAIRRHQSVSSSGHRFIEVDCDINDPRFAGACASIAGKYPQGLLILAEPVQAVVSTIEPGGRF